MIKLKHMNFAFWSKITLFITALVSVTLVYCYNIQNQMLHEDEHAWVEQGSKFFELYFLDHNYTNDIWKGYFGLQQPKLGEYLYGLTTYLTYRKNPVEVLRSVDFYEGGPNETGMSDYQPEKWWIKYQASYNQLTSIPLEWQNAYQVIVANRYLSIGFTLLALLCVFILGYWIGGFWTGLVSFVLASQHQLIYSQGRHAMADGMLLFFLLGSAVIFRLISTITSWSWKKVCLGAVVIGVFLGMAFSIKLNAAMAGVIGGIWLLLSQVKLNLKKRKIAFPGIGYKLVLLVTAAGVTFGTFMVLNPYIWPNPVKNTLYMLEWRQQTAVQMQLDNPGIAYETASKRLLAMAGQTLMPFGYNHRALPWIPEALDLVLVCIGVLVSVLEYDKKKKQGLKHYYFWLFGTVVFMLNYLAIAFDRYFLPIIPYIVLLEGYGLARGLSFLYNGMKDAVVLVRNKSARLIRS